MGTMRFRNFHKAWLFLLFFLLWSLPAASVAARGPTPPGVTPFGRTLLAQINLYRRDQGLSELTFDPALVKMARTHSFRMFQQKRLSHLDFKQRFARSGSRLCVENIGRDYANALKQFDGWRGSVGHDRNMLTPDLRKAGIAEVGGYVTFIACQ
jgi:uncharacterized protein YkwD